MKRLIMLIMFASCILLLSACSCKHEQTEIRNAVDASCVTEGYSGDIYCLKCNEKVTDGQTIPLTDHIESELRGMYDPECTIDGYTGDTYCTVCNTLMTRGESIPAVGHTEGDVTEQIDASCTDDGYTGNTCCTVCGEIISKGEIIPPAGHLPSAPEDVLDPTCTTKGYTGDIYCTVCSALIQPGEPIDKLPHALGEYINTVLPTCTVEGYEGDRICSGCKTEFSGKAIPRADHEYVNNVCIHCGYLIPGLYIDEELALSWQDLINQGYITESDNILTDMTKTLYGKLVLRDGITAAGEEVFCKTDLSTVVLPMSFNYIPTFNGSKNLVDVKWYANEIVSMGTFKKCTSLISFTVPEGITSLSGTFSGCKSLENVNLPDTLLSITSGAFNNCTSLKTLNIPDSVEKIGSKSTLHSSSFSGSGITELIMPANLSFIGYQISIEELTYIDFSKCVNLTELDCFFESCPSLSKITFPPNLVEFSGVLGKPYNKVLTHLDFPDTTQSVNGDWFSNLKGVTSIVWPKSLTEYSSLKELKNLSTIYYCGSEMQWNLMGGPKAFPKANVIFDYVRQ